VAEVNQAQALRKWIIPLHLAPLNDVTYAREAPPVLRRLQINSRYSTVEAHACVEYSSARVSIPKPVEWSGVREPYPGLSSFDQTDPAVCFGRDQEITDLLSILHSCRASGCHRIRIVQGASGTGKSSLVRVGV